MTNPKGLIEYMEDFGHAALRLSALQPHEYDGVRKEEAEKLDVRVGTLDKAVEKIWQAAESESKTGNGQELSLPEPEPWPEPVNGADLLDAIVTELQRYIVLPDHAAEALALWTVHAHALDAAYISPRLAITSPLPRCGKSTVLFILWPLVVRPLHAANLTAATVFRTVDMVQPSLLIDEADTFLGDKDELQGILNSGHCRDGATVIRLVGDNHEPKAFSTWAPVAIAMIGKLTGALADRAIEIQMRRKGSGEFVEKFRRDRSDSFKVLGRKIARWTADHIDALRIADAEVPETLNDRQSDNWRFLLAVADLAGGNWPVRARDAAKGLSGSSDDGDDLLKVRLLRDVRDTFDARGDHRISAANLCQALANIEESPWASFGRSNKSITPTQLARQLKPFGVKSKTLRLPEGERLKGYERGSFGDAFERYIPLPSQDTPSQSVTPCQTNENNNLAPESKRDTATNVTLQKPLKPAENSQSHGVTLPQGGPGDREGQSGLDPKHDESSDPHGNVGPKTGPNGPDASGWEAEI